MINYNEAIETCKKLKDKQYRYANVDDVYDDLENVESTLITCRNELCLQCGKYKDLARASFDWCSDCRWRQ